MQRMGEGFPKEKETEIISLSQQKIIDMIVASIEQLCPEHPDWTAQCEALRSESSLPGMVWVALQMGLWLARGVLEAELKQRAEIMREWPICKQYGHRLQSKGWRERQIETMVGSIR